MLKSIKWIDENKLWEISTQDVKYYAQFVINASGPLSTPVIPDFKGKDTFKGKSFHINNWDHSYDYKNKRVAIASAAQVIPTIAPDVKELHIFQRTPHWVLPRPDKKFSAVEQELLGNNLVYQAVRKIDLLVFRNQSYWF
jgi:cation diffusion facilitator CzcD-associated flavoprotein CzcO